MSNQHKNNIYTPFRWLLFVGSLLCVSTCIAWCLFCNANQSAKITDNTSKAGRIWETESLPPYTLGTQTESVIISSGNRSRNRILHHFDLLGNKQESPAATLLLIVSKILTPSYLSQIIITLIYPFHEFW